MDERDKQGLAECVVTMLLCASMGFCGGLYQENSKLQQRLNDSIHFANVDRDRVADLVTSDGKIFLADQTTQGITYRRLTSSDRYRIQG